MWTIEGGGHFLHDKKLSHFVKAVQGYACVKIVLFFFLSITHWYGAFIEAYMTYRWLDKLTTAHVNKEHK